MRYVNYFGDGDSSAYPGVVKAKPYGHIEIKNATVYQLNKKLFSKRTGTTDKLLVRK